MNRSNILSLSVITVLGLASLLGNAVAQQKSLKEQLVGTWTIVLCEVVQPDGTKTPLVVGNDPTGQYIFTDTRPGPIPASRAAREDSRGCSALRRQETAPFQTAGQTDSLIS